MFETTDALFQGKGDLDKTRLALAALPAATDLPAITASAGVAGDTSNPASSEGGGGLSLGAPTTYTLTSSDGVFTWQFPARSATMDDATVVMIPTLPVQP